MFKIIQMKKIPGLSAVVLLSTLILSCRQSPVNQALVNSDAKLEVIYFHTSLRCPACIAIENNTKKVLEDYFKSKIDSGIIKFTACNIDEKANRSLVKKYQVSYLTLLIVNANGTKTDFTDASFKYADTKPEKFTELLRYEIDKNLE